jgi:uncharacterized protein YndB with AHSA1/START domain
VTPPSDREPDPQLDLLVERLVDVPRELVWAAYLEIVENTRLAWTTVLEPGFRPAKQSPAFPFTAVVSIESTERGTKYSALAMHGHTDTRAHHEAAGFHDGWSTALDQLVAAMS